MTHTLKWHITEDSRKNGYTLYIGEKRIEFNNLNEIKNFLTNIRDYQIKDFLNIEIPKKEQEIKPLYFTEYGKIYQKKENKITKYILSANNEEKSFETYECAMTVLKSYIDEQNYSYKL